MRWYVVVEGAQTEKRIYQAWFKHVFPDIESVLRIEDMDEARYTKTHPGDACEFPYLRELVDHVDQTAHLSSLRFLIQHWRELGASI